MGESDSEKKTYFTRTDYDTFKGARKKTENGQDFNPLRTKLVPDRYGLKYITTIPCSDTFEGAIEDYRANKKSVRILILEGKLDPNDLSMFGELKNGKSFPIKRARFLN